MTTTMISVQASGMNRPAAREFFELFKTPWKFHVAGAPAGVLLSDGTEAPVPGAGLLIVFSGELLADEQGPAAAWESREGPGWFEADGLKMPVYGRLAVEKGSARVVCERGRKEGRPFVRVGFDLFAEVRHLLEAGQPAENAGIAEPK